MMKQAIDVRDFHTAIHSLYVIKSKPKTAAKKFLQIAKIQEEQIPEDAAYFCRNLWDFISENTEEPFEYNVNTQRNGTAFWHKGHLMPGCITVTIDGETFDILESVTLY